MFCVLVFFFYCFDCLFMGVMLVKFVVVVLLREFNFGVLISIVVVEMFENLGMLIKSWSCLFSFLLFLIRLVIVWLILWSCCLSCWSRVMLWCLINFIVVFNEWFLVVVWFLINVWWVICNFLRLSRFLFGGGVGLSVRVEVMVVSIWVLIWFVLVWVFVVLVNWCICYGLILMVLMLVLVSVCLRLWW